MGSNRDMSAMNPGLPHKVVEEYMRLLNNLLSQDNSKEIKILMISSSVHGEGSSYVASNFSKVLVENGGYSVLLIDGNLRNPSLYKIFNLKKEDGLSDFLSGDLDIEGLSKRSSIPNLQIITSGRNKKSAQGKLFENNRFKDFLKIAREKFDYVIFDSAPVNLYTDSLILGSLVDGTILVVQAEKTRWEVVLKTKDTLQKTKANVLGVVLNRRKYYIPDFVYKRL